MQQTLLTSQKSSQEGVTVRLSKHIRHLLDRVPRRTMQVLDRKSTAKEPVHVSKRISVEGQLAINKIKAAGIALHPYDEAFIGEMGFDDQHTGKLIRAHIVDFFVSMKQAGLSFEPIDENNPALTFLLFANAPSHKNEILRLIKSGIITTIPELCLLYEQSSEKKNKGNMRDTERILCPPHFDLIEDAQAKHLIPVLKTPEDRATMIQVCGRLTERVNDFFFYLRKKFPRNADEYSEVARQYSWWDRRHIDEDFDGLAAILVPHGLGNFGFTKAGVETLSKLLDDEKIAKFASACTLFTGGIKSDGEEIYRHIPCNLPDVFLQHTDLIETFILHARDLGSFYAGEPGEKHFCIYSPERLILLLQELTKFNKKDYDTFVQATRLLPPFTVRQTVAHQFMPPNLLELLEDAKKSIPDYLNQAGFINKGIVPPVEDRFEWSLTSTNSVHFDQKTGSMTVGEIIEKLSFWSTSSWKCRFKHEYGESIGKTRIFNGGCPFKHVNPGCGHPEMNGIGKLLFEADILAGGNGQRCFLILAQIFMNDSDATYDGSNQGKGGNYTPVDRPAILAAQERNASQVRAACLKLLGELEKKFPQ